MGAVADLTDVLGFCIIVLTHVSRFRFPRRSLCFSWLATCLRVSRTSWDFVS